MKKSKSYKVLIDDFYTFLVSQFGKRPCPNVIFGADVLSDREQLELGGVFQGVVDHVVGNNHLKGTVVACGYFKRRRVREVVAISIGDDLALFVVAYIDDGGVEVRVFPSAGTTGDEYKARMATVDAGMIDGEECDRIFSEILYRHFLDRNKRVLVRTS